MYSGDGLNIEQVRQYHERGFLGPFDLFSKREATEHERNIRREIGDGETDLDDLEGVHPLASRHLDCPTIYDCSTQDKIVNQMTDIYGEDLILWESKLFYKRPGEPEVPWHQHYHHMPMTPKTSVTAWIALSDCDTENGCLEFVPESNNEPLPQTDAPDHVAPNKMTDPEYFDSEEAVEIEMEAGQYVLFSETTLHKSSTNDAEDTRKAIAVRASPTHVRFDSEQYGKDPDIENNTPILLSGADDYQVNELASPEFY